MTFSLVQRLADADAVCSLMRVLAADNPFDAYSADARFFADLWHRSVPAEPVATAAVRALSTAPGLRTADARHAPPISHDARALSFDSMLSQDATTV
jgi:hypothetical protein